MIQVSIHEAKTHLSRLLVQVESGEEVVIARSGRPVARLVSLAGKARVPDQDAGQVVIAPDFDAPLPADLLDDFES